MSSEEDDEDEGEDEDDDGFLATGALDDQVNATLHAIRNKDPRVYTTRTTFYPDDKSGDATESNSMDGVRKNPLSISRYHWKNLLDGTDNLATEASQPTYSEQQDELQKSILHEIDDATNKPIPNYLTSKLDDAGDDFLTKKECPLRSYTNHQHTSVSAMDVKTADTDPEAFLSKFLSSRAWVTSADTKTHSFQSDDEEEDQRAEDIEEAYNLRFENHHGVNEKLVSHARDTVVRFSVRKKPTSKRKRVREADHLKKEAAKSKRSQEKAQLRKFRAENVEEKLEKLKNILGMSGHTLDMEKWINILSDDWDNNKWESEMAKNFGIGNHCEEQPQFSDDEPRSKRAKKPEWGDDIDITDLISVSDNGDRLNTTSVKRMSYDSEKYAFTNGIKGQAGSDNGQRKEEFRRERRKVEQLIDHQLELDIALKDINDGEGARFNYRETSPVAFGLTASDILMASDSQLNQYAGLKRMATFRDPIKKMKDRKQIGKRGRLRNWRKETFGNEKGPQGTFQDMIRLEGINKVK